MTPTKETLERAVSALETRVNSIRETPSFNDGSFISKLMNEGANNDEKAAQEIKEYLAEIS